MLTRLLDTFGGNASADCVHPRDFSRGMGLSFQGPRREVLLSLAGPRNLVSGALRVKNFSNFFLREPKGFGSPVDTG